MNYNKMSKRIGQFDKEAEKQIISTRIRVARNLAGYPLGPGLSQEQRLEIEQKIIEACS